MEFALVIPILIILFVAIADFGRIFATGVTIEAAARNAAEVAAQEYLSAPPAPLNSPAPTGNGAYYGQLAARAAKVVCAETRDLPSSDYDPSDGTCKTWPVVRVCVHDGVDEQCGLPITGFASTIPPECSQMNAPWSPSQEGSNQRWVEVRLCYQFTSLVNVPLVSFGTFYLERSRKFVIACYFALGTGDCG